MKNKLINPLQYFPYFYKYLGNNMILFIFLNIMVGLLDGIGLAMFIPLLAIVMGSELEGESLGKLNFIVDFIEGLGFGLNIYVVLAMLISLFTIKGCIYYFKVICLIKLRLTLIKKIRLSLIKKLRSLSYEGFTKIDQGKIQNNMIGETTKLMSSCNLYFHVIQHIVMLFTFLVLAMLSNWKFALMVGVGGLLTNVIYKYVNSKTKGFSLKQIGVSNEFNGFLIQSVHNFKYLKATNYFDKYERKLTDNIEQSLNINYRMGKVSGFGESIREPLIIIIIASVIMIMTLFFEGNTASVLTSLLLIYRGLAHLVTMQGYWNDFLPLSSSIDSIEDMLREFDNNKEEVNSTIIPAISDISVENISLSFGSKKVIDDVSLNISKNKSIAFIGESGAGKTTLANVICGLQKPSVGTIKIGNLSLYDCNLNSYRDKIGYITQESVIFDDTIYNNVTFWSEKTPENMEKFYKTMETVSLMSFINNLEFKEDTELGNNGLLISGGQKQRITIARELFKDIELLIMDEATSALDSETEKYIKENIDLLQGKCTMIIIAHRLSTIKDVDEIYLMDKGKIKEYGNFEELYTKSEKFKNLVELQKL